MEEKPKIPRPQSIAKNLLFKHNQLGFQQSWDCISLLQKHNIKLHDIALYAHAILEQTQSNAQGTQFKTSIRIKIKTD